MVCWMLVWIGDFVNLFVNVGFDAGCVVLVCLYWCG